MGPPLTNKEEDLVDKCSFLFLSYSLGPRQSLLAFRLCLSLFTPPNMNDAVGESKHQGRLVPLSVPGPRSATATQYVLHRHLWNSWLLREESENIGDRIEQKDSSE